MDKNYNMSITFDDIPVHGSVAGEISRKDIVDFILSATKKHDLPSMVGFVNMGKLKEGEKNHEEVVDEWVSQGGMLGNHTYSHLDLREVSAQEFVCDIRKNQELIVDKKNNTNFFRYPYLLEGDSYEKLVYIKNYLDSNGYKVCPVSVDFLDFLWNDPVAWCIKNNKYSNIEKLKELYIKTALCKIKSAKEISLKYYKRNINHVMLLHAGIATAIFFNDLIDEIKNEGVNIVNVQDSMQDPCYMISPLIVSKKGRNHLMKTAFIHEEDLSSYPQVPRSLINEIGYKK